ncbi:MAG: hypothetical protein EHM25_06865 [Nitrosopumilales archaeon]|nr:MAG: hypothetical protein EHM25_06865 [Nitrosopumilales archaeon]
MSLLSFLKKKKKETITTKELPAETTPGKKFIDYGTYNPVTGVYTNPQGQGYSTATPPPGAITVIAPGSKSGAGSSGTYYPDSGTYVDSSGKGFSMAVPPIGATISSTSNPQLKGLSNAQLVTASTQKNKGSIINPDFEAYDSGGKIKYRRKDTGTIFIKKDEQGNINYSTGENLVGGQGYSVAEDRQQAFLQQQAQVQVQRGDFSNPTEGYILPGDVSEILTPSNAETNYNLTNSAKDVDTSMRNSFKDIFSVPPSNPYYAKGTVNNLLYPKGAGEPTKFQNYLAQSLKETPLPEDTKSFKQLYQENNLPAIMRKSFTETIGKGIGFITSKITGQKPNQEINKMIGETFLFAGVSNVMPSTAQIYKELNVKNSLSFLGASQQVKNNIVNTDLVFNVQTGKNTQKGIASGVSAVVGSSGEKSAFVTIGKGGFVKRFVEFPTGKIKYKFNKPFEGIEIGVVKNLDDNVVMQVGAGRINTQVSKDLAVTQLKGKALEFPTGRIIQDKKNPNFIDFVSASLSARKGDYTFNIGEIANKGGQTEFAGIIKEANKNIVSNSFVGGMTQSKIINRPALSSLKSIVSASIKTPANIPKPLINAPMTTIFSATKQIPFVTSKELKQITSQEISKPVSIYSGTGLYERTEGGQLPGAMFKINLLTSSTPLVSQKSLLGLGQLQLQLQGQRTKQKTKQDTSLTQGQTPKSAQVSRLRLGQLQLQQQKIQLVQQQRQKQLSKFFPKFRGVRTTRSFIPFNFKPYKQPTQRGGVFSVSVRRKGKFLPIGSGLSWKQAQSLGIKTTQYGLGQSFKVRNMFGVTPKQATPQGYYPKYSKKEGMIFIEMPKTKINTRQEKSLLSSLSRQGRMKNIFSPSMFGRKKKKRGFYF